MKVVLGTIIFIYFRLIPLIFQALLPFIQLVQQTYSRQNNTMKFTHFAALLALATPLVQALDAPVLDKRLPPEEPTVRRGQPCTEYGLSRCCRNPTNENGDPIQRCDCLQGLKAFAGGRTCAEGKRCYNGRCIPA